MIGIPVYHVFAYREVCYLQKGFECCLCKAFWWVWIINQRVGYCISPGAGKRRLADEEGWEAISSNAKGKKRIEKAWKARRRNKNSLSQNQLYTAHQRSRGKKIDNLYQTKHKEGGSGWVSKHSKSDTSELTKKYSKQREACVIRNFEKN